MNRWLLALTAIASLAACAGGPQGPVVCNDPPIPSLSMVYPVPGATNVPDSLSTLVFAGQPLSGPSGSPSIELSVGDTQLATISAFGAAPSPLPSPAVSPLPAGPYESISIPSLSPHTTYSVTYQYTFPGSGECAGTVNMPMGNFTTQ